MIKELLKTEIQDFIRDHEGDDVQELLLRHKYILGLPAGQIVDQIMARRKAKIKLPEFYSTRDILYPPQLNLEQSSSEATAKYKAALIQKLKVNTIADLTGGFGIDSYYMGSTVKNLDFVEQDGPLIEIARHNHLQLGLRHVVYYPVDAEKFLSGSGDYDLFYIDPARRKKTNKVFLFGDSSPDVIRLQALLLQKAPLVLIKASPLLDLKKGSDELAHVAQIVVVSVENECKELLFLLQRDYEGEPEINTLDLDRRGEPRSVFSFTFSEERNAAKTFSSPQEYLYEPNSAVLKAGAFKRIGQSFDLQKLAPATHLYTSEKIIPGFPGRIFKVIESVKLDRKIQKYFPGVQANILRRNHPLSVEEIKRKTGLTEGGERYLICAKDKKEKVSLIAERIK